MRTNTLHLTANSSAVFEMNKQKKDGNQMSWINKKLEDNKKNIAKRLADDLIEQDNTKRIRSFCQNNIFKYTKRIERLIDEANKDFKVLGKNLCLELEIQDGIQDGYKLLIYPGLRIHSREHKDDFLICYDKSGSKEWVSLLFRGVYYSIDRINLSGINKTHIVNMMGIISGNLEVKYFSHHSVTYDYMFLHFDGLISPWRFWVRYFFDYVINYKIFESKIM